MIDIEDGRAENNRPRFAVKIKSLVPTRRKISVGVFGDQMASEVKVDMPMVAGASMTRLRPAGGRQEPRSFGGGRDVRSSA